MWSVQELEKNWPKDFGKDITTISPNRNFTAKKIYNVTVGAYRNQKSMEVHQLM
jgi:hypothetical protein